MESKSTAIHMCVFRAAGGADGTNVTFLSLSNCLVFVSRILLRTSLGNINVEELSWSVVWLMSAPLSGNINFSTEDGKRHIMVEFIGGVCNIFVSSCGLEGVVVVHCRNPEAPLVIRP